MPERATRAEDSAARVLAAVEGREVVRTDFGTGRQIHDFELTGAPTAAIEVTEWTMPSHLATRGAANRHFDELVPDPTLRGEWHLLVDTTMDRAPVMKGLSTSVLPVLHRLEACGLDQVTDYLIPTGPTGRYDRAIAELGKLVNWWPLFSYDGPGTTPGLRLVLSGSTVSSTRSNEVAGHLAAWIQEPDQSDNVRKVGASGATHRHIFVVVDDTAVGAGYSIRWLGRDERWIASPPDVTVELPAEITHLWGAVIEGPVWRFSRREGWTLHCVLRRR